MLEYCFIIVEECGLVADDEVGRVASEEVLRVGEGDYLAAVAEFDGGSHAMFDDGVSLGFRDLVQELVDLVPEDHALSESWGDDEGEVVGVVGAVPDEEACEDPGFAALAGPAESYAFVALGDVV